MERITFDEEVLPRRQRELPLGAHHRLERVCIRDQHADLRERAAALRKIADDHCMRAEALYEKKDEPDSVAARRSGYENGVFETEVTPYRWVIPRDAQRDGALF